MFVSLSFAIGNVIIGGGVHINNVEGKLASSLTIFKKYI